MSSFIFIILQSTLESMEIQTGEDSSLGKKRENVEEVT